MEARKWSRRSVLGAGAGGVLACAGARDAAAEAADFSFAVINDVHYLNDECAPWIQGVFRQIGGHAEKPEFCLLVGDLTENGTDAQNAGIGRVIRETAGVPVYSVPGNHDYVTAASRAPYDKSFPDRVNYRFTHRGWHFIGLDSTDGQKYQQVAMPPSSLAFLEKELAAVPVGEPMVLFTHFPLGENVRHTLTNAPDVLARTRRHSLRAVFGGHFHSLTERKNGETPVLTNRCCSHSKGNHDGTPEKGYFLCSVKNGALAYRFVAAKLG